MIDGPSFKGFSDSLSEGSAVKRGINSPQVPSSDSIRNDEKMTVLAREDRVFSSSVAFVDVWNVDPLR